jgi:hypothetical protein
MAKAKKKTIEEEIVESVSEKVEVLDEVGDNKKAVFDDNQILSCGDPIVNLHLSGRCRGGFLYGKYHHLVGESSAGKSWICMSVFAESSLHPVFKKHTLIYDNVEDGMLADMDYFFGSVTAKRIKAPRYDGDEPSFSITVEDFFDNLERKIQEARETGVGFIYVLDSYDGLSSESDMAMMLTNMKLREEGKEVKNSMGMGKAKAGSTRFGNICRELKETGSFIFIISQQKNKFNPTGATNKHHWAGGDWLKYYSATQSFLFIKDRIEKTIKGKKRPIGTEAKINIRKSRQTGQRHSDIPLRIVNTFGIDGIYNCVDYLVSESVFSGKATPEAKIDVNGLLAIKAPMNREKISQWIEEKDEYEKLFDLVQDCFDGIQLEIEKKVKRKRRYI